MLARSAFVATCSCAEQCSHRLSYFPAFAEPMPEATRVPERKFGVCPIIFQEDFLEEKKENTPQTPYAQDTCMIIKSAAKELVKSVKNRLLSRV